MNVYTVIKNVFNGDDDSVIEIREIVSADNIGQVFDSLATDLLDESLEIVAVHYSGAVARQLQGGE